VLTQNLKCSKFVCLEFLDLSVFVSHCLGFLEGFCAELPSEIKDKGKKDKSEFNTSKSNMK